MISPPRSLRRRDVIRLAGLVLATTSIYVLYTDFAVLTTFRKPAPRVLEAHHWGSDGLLTVNPKGPHPIFQLITRAETAWAEKHNRASKTLQEAVVEYERRYRRPPPLGFGAW